MRPSARATARPRPGSHPSGCSAEGGATTRTTGPRRLRLARALPSPSLALAFAARSAFALRLALGSRNLIVPELEPFSAGGRALSAGAAAVDAPGPPPLPGVSVH